MSTYALSSASVAEDSRTVRLTKREVEVLTLVIEGKSSKEVADQLFVSKRTVDFHLANIYQKLDVTNRVQAFREATRRGLISFSIGNGASAAPSLSPSIGGMALARQ
jgi:DNA-binding CsgD family transcriptional regulator